jgi:calnexin
MPDVAAGLAAAFFTLIGMLAALFGLMGSSKPVVCPAREN